MAQAIPVKEQAKAAHENLSKIEDAALRRRMAGWMLEEIEKDQKAAAEKMLRATMRANVGAMVAPHVEYATELEPVAQAIREVMRDSAKAGNAPRPAVA